MLKMAKFWRCFKTLDFVEYAIVAIVLLYKDIHCTFSMAILMSLELHVSIFHCLRKMGCLCIRVTLCNCPSVCCAACMHAKIGYGISQSG